MRRGSTPIRNRTMTGPPPGADLPGPPAAIGSKPGMTPRASTLAVVPPDRGPAKLSRATPTDAIIAIIPIGMVVWLLWDLFVVAYARGSLGWPTITHRTIELTGAYPAIPYFVGFASGGLAMHFWGQF